MKVSKSVNVAMNGKLVGDLKQVLDKVPNHARINVYVSKGDRPWESDTVEITLKWDEEL